MTSPTFEYTGKHQLEALQEAKNYNLYLEKMLLAFLSSASHILDFGAGMGEFADRLKRRGLVIDCLEPDQELRTLLEQKGHTAYAAAQDLSPSYSHIYSLNVLEHIEDDLATLKQLHHLLLPGGKLLLFVPAFMMLYSSLDKQVGHYRRYSKGELGTKLTASGFTINTLHYVDSLGFLAWLIMKQLGNKEGQLNKQAVMLFDRLIFPLSRMVDQVAAPFFGKNLLAIATK